MEDFGKFIATKKSIADKLNEHPIPMLTCKDGFTMSVQVGKYLYCEPKIDTAPYYSKVEVGFPSKEESLLMPYVEDINHPTETVYGYVPVYIIEQVIDKHGGLK